MKFLDADVKRPVASVSAIVDEGNVVKFGPQDSKIESVRKGQRIPMSRMDGVFVVQLEAQAMMSNVTTDSVKLMETETTGPTRRWVCDALCVVASFLYRC